MFRNILNAVVFLAGLIAVCWIGAGYVGSNLLGVAITAVIGACYLAGARELYRYRQATSTLTEAIAAAGTAQANLHEWLEQLHPSLRSGVRLRIEGERVPLPAPALTPYLVGLLVLLGMLGTLLGMMATLSGTGMALESASDLEAIRGSLGTPVKGLAFAFGTSIAGVASSAMLGLLSSLCRRERLEAVQQLDLQIATSLRPHSRIHQREEAFRLLQQQSGLMPTLVDRLQTMMTALEQQNASASERLLASQHDFHTRTEAGYARLAASIEQSLNRSVADSASAVGTALQPLMQSTMAGIARETSAMHDHVSQAVEQQLDGLSTTLQKTATTVADTWKAAVAEQQQSNEALTRDLRGSLEQFSDSFGQRSSGLIDAVSARLDSTGHLVQSRFDGLAASIEATATSIADTWKAAASEQTQSNQVLAGDLHTSLDHFGAVFQQRSEALVDTVSARMEASSTTVAETLGNALAGQQAANAELAERNQQAMAAAASTFEAHAKSLVGVMQQSHAELQEALELRDQQRLASWAEALGSMTTELNANLERSSEHVAIRQQEICDTLARTATEIGAQAQAHASDTISEISRLVQVASEAPKAAADVIAELRQKLSDSMAHDTAMLEERSRLLATLETLLDAVNHASTEQRTAVDALVTTSADLLERVSSRFGDHIQSETGKLSVVAAQVSGSAVEVASLGETLGVAVKLFGKSNDALMDRLQHIGDALEKSLLRSDEQLAYYVAQAREVVDLSMLSQKQIIGELGQLAGRPADGGNGRA